VSDAYAFTEGASLAYVRSDLRVRHDLCRFDLLEAVNKRRATLDLDPLSKQCRDPVQLTRGLLPMLDISGFFNTPTAWYSRDSKLTYQFVSGQKPFWVTGPDGVAASATGPITILDPPPRFFPFVITGWIRATGPHTFRAGDTASVSFTYKGSVVVTPASIIIVNGTDIYFNAQPAYQGLSIGLPPVGTSMSFVMDDRDRVMRGVDFTEIKTKNEKTVIVSVSEDRLSATLDGSYRYFNYGVGNSLDSSVFAPYKYSLHNFLVGQLIDVVWDGGYRSRVRIDTADNDTIHIVEGAGDLLPPSGTTIYIRNSPTCAGVQTVLDRMHWRYCRNGTGAITGGYYITKRISDDEVVIQSPGFFGGGPFHLYLSQNKGKVDLAWSVVGADALSAGAFRNGMVCTKVVSLPSSFVFEYTLKGGTGASVPQISSGLLPALLFVHNAIDISLYGLPPDQNTIKVDYKDDLHLVPPLFSGDFGVLLPNSTEQANTRVFFTTTNALFSQWMNDNPEIWLHKPDTNQRTAWYNGPFSYSGRGIEDYSYWSNVCQVGSGYHTNNTPNPGETNPGIAPPLPRDWIRQTIDKIVDIFNHLDTSELTELQPFNTTCVSEGDWINDARYLSQNLPNEGPLDGGIYINTDAIRRTTITGSVTGFSQVLPKNKTADLGGVLGAVIAVTEDSRFYQYPSIYDVLGTGADNTNPIITSSVTIRQYTQVKNTIRDNDNSPPVWYKDSPYLTDYVGPGPLLGWADAINRSTTVLNTTGGQFRPINAAWQRNIPAPYFRIGGNVRTTRIFLLYAYFDFHDPWVSP